MAPQRQGCVEAAEMTKWLESVIIVVLALDQGHLGLCPHYSSNRRNMIQLNSKREGRHREISVGTKMLQPELTQAYQHLRRELPHVTITRDQLMLQLL